MAEAEGSKIRVVLLSDAHSMACGAWRECDKILASSIFLVSTVKTKKPQYTHLHIMMRRRPQHGLGTGTWDWRCDRLFWFWVGGWLQEKYFALQSCYTHSVFKVEDGGMKNSSDTMLGDKETLF